MLSFTKAIETLKRDQPDDVPAGLRQVYVVRHGQTKMNNASDESEDRIRGWLDVPLTDVGREEAVGAAEQLTRVGVEVIVTSDLSRAEETAQIIGQAVGIKPSITDKLRPWDLGDLTGQPTSEVLADIARYVTQAPDDNVPGGESFNSFKARAFAGISEACSGNKDKVLVLVT